MTASTLNQPMPTQMATAITECRMRRRSSSRCWSRLMEPIWRSSCSRGLSGSATRSGIVIPWDGVLHALAQAIESTLNGEIFIRGELGDFRFDMLARICFFQFQLANLFMNLALKFAAGFLEFRHELTHGPGNFRQLPRPKEEQGQDHQEDHFSKTEVHTLKL